MLLSTTTMKRVAPKTIWSASAVENKDHLNSSQRTHNRNFRSRSNDRTCEPVRLKPRFPEGKPCYDPHEAHIHVWKAGFLIKNLAQIFDKTKIVRMAFLIKFGTKIYF